MLSSSARTRGVMFSGLRSSIGSASQPSWKSTRHMPSACLCSSTLWPGWNGGSNQKRRSVERMSPPTLGTSCPRCPPEGGASALGRARRRTGIHRDVGDQEAIAEHAALGLLAQQLAQVGARAVAGGDVGGRQPVVAFGRFHGEHGAVVALLDARHLVVPAQVDERQRSGALHEVALDVVLLQVDEGRPLVAGLGQQVEAVDLLVVEEHLAHVPRDALVHHAVAAAQAIEHFERALGKADRARAAGEGVVVVQQHHRHLAQREVDGEREADRAGTDDHDRPMGWGRGVLVGVAVVVEAQTLIVDHVCLRVLGLCSFPLWGKVGMGASGARNRRSARPHPSPPPEGEGARPISLPAPSTSRRRARPSTRADRHGPRPRRTRGSRRTACSGRRSPTGCIWA
jgi:hypothetical protein